MLSLSNESSETLRRVEFEHQLGTSLLNKPSSLPFNQRLLFYMLSQSPKKGAEKLDQELKDTIAVLRTAEPPFSSSFSFAPIRSKPKRTYDELSDAYSPEGDRVPTLLSRLLKEEPTSKEGRRLQEALMRFGQESGLFKKIDVKRLGNKASDPFQIQVTGSGPAVNLADVGYGVSQALPIVVQSVLKTASKVMLLQQPEAHLHPRAQAALGTFFSELAATGDRMFLIETHSDYTVCG